MISITKKNNTIPTCLLLPGSRNFEVELLLPVFIKAVEQIKQQFGIKVTLLETDNVNKNLYSPYREKIDTIYKSEKISAALKEADYALAASGTITLATALFTIPTIVAYKGSLLNEFVFYNLIHYGGFICLPNIICGEEIFPELLQNQATSFNIREKLLHFLNNNDEYHKIQNKLLEIQKLLKGECEDCGSYIGEHIKTIYDKPAV